ncbi:MFS transporter [Ferruginibacter sp.]
MQKTVGATATLLYSAAIFVVVFVMANRLPGEVIAARAAGQAEEVELHSDGVVLVSNTMLLLRGEVVGFTFFHLFFWFRAQDAGLVWFGLSLGFASILTMGGNAAAPFIRSKLREETMLVVTTAIVAAAGLGTAFLGGVVSGMLLAGSVNFSAAIGRLAFEAIVQRDAPDANRGRAFAQYETRFQLGWVGAGVVPVLLSMPGRLGFVLVGTVGVATVLYYAIGSRAVERGHVIPLSAGCAGHRRRGAPPCRSVGATGQAAGPPGSSRSSGCNASGARRRGAPGRSAAATPTTAGSSGSSGTSRQAPRSAAPDAGRSP